MINFVSGAKYVWPQNYNYLGGGGKLSAQSGYVGMLTTSTGAWGHTTGENLQLLVLVLHPPSY